MSKFTDVQFMTAKEKELVFKNWQRFIKALSTDWRNAFNAFTKRLYQHLTLHCSFIAHYDRHGFYQTYFADPETIPNFFRGFDRDQGYSSFEYGFNYHMNGDFNDINQAMADELEEYKHRIYTIANHEARERDLQAAKALLKKHGIEQR